MESAEETMELGKKIKKDKKMASNEERPCMETNGWVLQ